MSQQKLRALALWFILSLLAGATTTTMAGCNASQQRRRGNSRRADAKPTTTPQPTPEEPLPDPARGEEKTVSDEIKILSRGNYSNEMLESFVAVSRDAETYAALRALNAQLPGLSADFFKRNAVVAAFLGQRRSGGYAVEITREAEGALRVSEKSPPKGAMTTMALTAPYHVVSYATPEENPVRLSLGAAWQQAARPYRVVLGEFTMMGGFAGVRELFNVTGTLGLMRYQDLATVLFDLGGDDANRPRVLSDAASGKVSSDKLTLTVDPGTFILPPRRRLTAEVTLGGGENKLHFTLDGMQAAVADGFGGRGQFDAEATAGPPKKIALDDDPM